MAAYDLSDYDGVLAFGDVHPRSLSAARLGDARLDLARGGRHARVPSALPSAAADGDLVWIGNWGDDERTGELREFLIEPVRQLGLRGAVHGVRYPGDGARALARRGISTAAGCPTSRCPRCSPATA